jgi:hypothetical protein
MLSTEGGRNLVLCPWPPFRSAGRKKKKKRRLTANTHTDRPVVHLKRALRLVYFSTGCHSPNYRKFDIFFGIPTRNFQNPDRGNVRPFLHRLQSFFFLLPSHGLLVTGRKLKRAAAAIGGGKRPKSGVSRALPAPVRRAGVPWTTLPTRGPLLRCCEELGRFSSARLRRNRLAGTLMGRLFFVFSSGGDCVA